VLSSVLPNPLIQAESLTAFEGGYRTQVVDRVLVDTTVFYNVYDDLRWEQPVTFLEDDPGPSHLVIGTHYENYRRAVTAGSETTIKWDVMPQWKLEGGFSLLASRFATNQSSGQSIHVDSPARQWRLGSGIDLPGALRFDVNVYHVSALETSNVPAYTRLDARLNHEFTPNVSLAVVGQNLLTPHHREFGTAYGFVSADIYRTAHLKLTWQF
jgi:iron complex outermembrane receptor protein